MKNLQLLFFMSIFFPLNNSSAQYQLTDAFPNLPNFSNLVDLQNAGDCTNRLFAVESAGIIRVFDNNPEVLSSKIFLNITDSVTSGGELGLLGLAFHPDYDDNGYFFVNYTAPNPRRTVVKKYRVSASNPDSADIYSGQILLEQSQPYSNHNGGQISFGPGGYLYTSFGDGGSGGDPENHAQTLTDFLGKILRIDVDNPDQSLNYGIPESNPFKNNTAGYKEEIYAYGLRNPWRFSFDTVTERLWCGDVGQNSYEEVDIIENGGNYGWRCYEGNHTYNSFECGESSDYAFPVWEYQHNPECSITGGFVYRGPNQPGLVGKYIYADYCSNKIWALSYDGINPPDNQLLTTAVGSPSTFGVDQANELYICSLGGRIYKFVPTAPITAPSGLSINIPAPLTVDLNWIDNSDNEEGFRIERMEINGDYTEIADVSANTNSYEEIVTQTIDYKYRVYAYNSTDVSGYSNEICVSGEVLPVEMSILTIEINRDGSSVILNWETASEKNNHGFEVERCMDSPFGENNETFETIGFVKGKGTTAEKSFYRYVDDFGNYSYDGTLRYRLKQIDLDGSSSYSGTVSININLLRKGYQLEQNYPNPFNPVTNIKFNIPEESKVKIQIINLLGEVITKLVDETKKPGFYNESWNASRFSSGVYYIKMDAESLVSDETYLHTIKILYLK